MATQLRLGSLVVDVVRKDIKNVHLSVYPPAGRVKISAPLHMKLDTIRVFAVAKLGWIKVQQQKILEQDRETPREYLDRESHYLWGKRYLLKVLEKNAAPSVTLSPRQLRLQVRDASDEVRKQAVLDDWYRAQLRLAAEALITKWAPIMQVRVNKLYVQRMKTKWGSCSPRLGNIRLNTELAKKPPECLEYIVVHELAHLLEPTHNQRFVGLLDQFMPNWRYYRDLLNRLPVRHERWTY